MPKACPPIHHANENSLQGCVTQEVNWLFTVSRFLGLPGLQAVYTATNVLPSSATKAENCHKNNTFLQNDVVANSCVVPCNFAVGR